MRIEENWKKIPGYNYSVSDLGRVRSDLRNDILTPHINEKGYARVYLYKNGKRRKFRIHRLVAQAFIPNPKNKPEVNHLSGNKLDNAVVNLEWATGEENRKHALENGLAKLFEKGNPYIFKKGHPYGKRFTKDNPYGGRNKKKVRIIETGKIYESITACAEDINGKRKGVSKALNGVNKAYKGFHFEYIS